MHYGKLGLVNKRSFVVWHCTSFRQITGKRKQGTKKDGQRQHTSGRHMTDWTQQAVLYSFYFITSLFSFGNQLKKYINNPVYKPVIIMSPIMLSGIWTFMCTLVKNLNSNNIVFTFLYANQIGGTDPHFYKYSAQVKKGYAALRTLHIFRLFPVSLCIYHTVYYIYCIAFDPCSKSQFISHHRIKYWVYYIQYSEHSV